MATVMQPPPMQPEVTQSDLNSLQKIERLLHEPRLLPAPRALLLLRMCQLAQLFRPELLAAYWSQLKGVAKDLSRSQLETYEGLKATIEPAPPIQRRGFAQQMMTAIEDASRQATTDGDAASRSFEQCAELLNRRWWPFGKSDLWNALLVSWAEIDRRAPLEMIGHLSSAAQENLLIQWNLKEPFSLGEWTTAASNAHGPAIRAVIAVLEKKDEPVLDLPDTFRTEVAEWILQDVHPVLITQQSWQVSAKRRNGLKNYLKLVQSALKQSPEAAASLLHTAYSAALTTNYFGQAWAERFASLQMWLKVWAGFPQLRGSAVSAIEHTPEYLRDFAFSQWYAALPANEEEIPTAWEAMTACCSDRATSQGWFLVTLVGRGFGAKAVQLAQASSQPASLLAQLRRAWLIEHQETAHLGISATELEDDLVGQFLYKTSRPERMEFLRTLTRNGKNPLPSEFWSKLGKFAGAVMTHKEIAGAAPNWYVKTTPQKDQFKDCLRINGHGNYLFEDLDPLLLAALVAWDENYPSETKPVFDSMWDEIRPADFELTTDLFRSGDFRTLPKRVVGFSPRLSQAVRELGEGEDG